MEAGLEFDVAHYGRCLEALLWKTRVNLLDVVSTSSILLETGVIRLAFQNRERATQALEAVVNMFLNRGAPQADHVEQGLWRILKDRYYRLHMLLQSQFLPHQPPPDEAHRYIDAMIGMLDSSLGQPVGQPAAADPD